MWQVRGCTKPQPRPKPCMFWFLCDHTLGAPWLETPDVQGFGRLQPGAPRKADVQQRFNGRCIVPPYPP